MKIPLTDVNPWVEISAMLAEANPTLDISKVKPYRMAAGAGRNTRLFLVGNSATGVAGKLYIEYDRLNPASVFSKFGDLTKNRPVRLYGLPGTVMKVSDVLRQINDLLGVELTMTGQFRDLAEANFTLPAKNTPIVLDILPYVSPAGDPPLNLRLMPTAKLSLNLSNGGAELKGLTKGLNPYVKSDGNINWLLGDRPLSDMSLSRDLALYNLDFSDTFGTTGLMNDCYKRSTVSLPGYYQYGYTFTDPVVDEINLKLALVGVPPLIKGRVHFIFDNTFNLDIVGNYVKGQGRAWTYTNSYMVNNAAGSVAIREAPANVNKNFSHVFKILPSNWPVNTSYADDLVSSDKLPESKRIMYFHFNTL